MSTDSLYEIFQSSKGVCTDTRKILPGGIFFALKGANFNGNKFAKEALKAGAAFAVIDEEEYKTDDRFILVKDVLTSLQKLARHHRRSFKIPFIAITGSNGKTTTKELISTVLSSKYKTYATIGNLNNHIGIPLTLLSVKTDAEMAIIEMGANHQKEIEAYCKIAEPSHGIITNIGKAHLEGFGGFEGVKKGKGELYEYLELNKGSVFINSSNPVLMEMNRISDPILFPQKGDFYQCTLIEAKPFISFKAENGKVYQTNLIGEYNFDNIAAALCIGKYFGVPSDKANMAVSQYTPENNRSQVVKKNSNTIILDAYNANPTSMRASIENFSKMVDKDKVVILGDMFELGDESVPEHAKIGILTRDKNFTKTIFCGNYMKEAAHEYPDALHFSDRSSLEDYIKSNPLSDSLILIKGSRGMGLEKIADLI